MLVKYIVIYLNVLYRYPAKVSFPVHSRYMVTLFFYINREQSLLSSSLIFVENKQLVAGSNSVSCIWPFVRLLFE